LLFTSQQVADLPRLCYTGFYESPTLEDKLSTVLPGHETRHASPDPERREIMAKIAPSQGTCAFCKGTFPRAGMTRHLKSCAAYQATLSSSQGRRASQTRFFHLFVEGSDAPEFWLHLDVRAAATLGDLDQFLRDIWLECCGHLSSFQIENRYYEKDTGAVDGMWVEFFGTPGPPQSMNVHLSSVLRPGLKFSHDYDFGSTTRLTLRVIAEHERMAPQNFKIMVLARNQLPELLCSVCGKPAAWIDTWGDYELFCEECGDAHEESQEGFLPVVNSPRMGVCGYTG
jgi:hypothetical protein